MEPKRVKIIDIYYNPKYDLVKWQVLFLDEKKEPVWLAWKSCDLAECLGIKKNIPSELMTNFCEQMKGKEFNLVMHSEISNLSSEQIKTEEKINKEHQRLDKYPFYEILKDLEENSK